MQGEFWGPASWGALSTLYQVVAPEIGLGLFKAQNLFSLFFSSGVWRGAEWGTGSLTFAPSRAESPEAV